MMLDCIDLFCGAGGLSLGLKRSGLKVRLAVDVDPDCELTYAANFRGSKFLRADITELNPEKLLKGIRSTENLVLAGGPPCQLFSRLNKAPQSNSREVAAYMSLIQKIQPGYVVLENVPAIEKRSDAWKLVISTLKRLGYYVEYGILKAVDFGLPQKRERMIVVAGRRPVRLPVGRSRRDISVKRAIGAYPESSSRIANHVSLQLSPQNVRRIAALSSGEKSRAGASSFSDSYSRMAWDRPAPTITTKCISFSNGRFGHPKYDRALTVREAATLQGFPKSFVFRGSLWSCARQVGNAVPPPIAEALGNAIVAAANG